MKKNIIILSVLAISGLAFGQVGINNQAPQATLDVTAKQINPTTAEGIIAPRLTGDEIMAKDAVYLSPQIGTLIYATAGVTGSPSEKTINITSPGYYYFNGAIWIKFAVGNLTVFDTTDDAWINDPTNSNPQVKIKTLSDGTTARPLGSEFVVLDTGFVGIGTSEPVAALDIVNSTKNTGDDIRVTSYGPWAGALQFYRIGGTPDIPTDNNPNDVIYQISGHGRFGGVRTSLSQIEARTIDGSTSKLSISNGTLNSSSIPVLQSVIVIDGANKNNVGINNATPSNKLHVTAAKDPIRAEGVREFTDNATATTAGLTVGTIYRTGDVLKIVH